MPARGWIVAAALLLASMTRQAGAQLGCTGATCTVEITMPVTDILRLSLSVPSVVLGTPSDVDFSAGFRDVPGSAVDVTVKANHPFSLQMAGLSPTFNYSGSMANPLKPASHLLWATSAAGLTGTPYTMATPATLFSGGATSITQSLYFRTLWNFATDVPGTYSLTISFTLSAP
jgi:hypothetical protein